MKLPLLALLLAAQSLLGGCSWLSTTRSAAAEGRSAILEAQETMRFLRQQQEHPDRHILVSLIGGNRLNQGSRSAPRPVKVCVYLSTTSDWIPPVDVPESACVTREREASLLASERRILAPDQLLQLNFIAPGTRDSWVVVDADFSERAPDYTALRIPVDNREQVQVNAWLDANRLSNANAPRTADAKP